MNKKFLEVKFAGKKFAALKNVRGGGYNYETGARKKIYPFDKRQR